MKTKKMFNYLEMSALIFAILSIISIVSYPNFFNKSLFINYSSEYPRALYGDAYNQGNSKAEWITSTESYKWHCILQNKYEYPYCTFNLNFIDPESGYGLDLSSYDEITIDYLYKGNKSDTFRIFLRTQHEGFTDRTDQNSYKFNELELKPNRDGSPITFLMTDFQAAHWWILQHNFPVELARPDFSEVMSLEILTGTNSSLGEKEFEIKSIALTGKTISRANFYLVIIVTWFIFLFLVIGYRLIKLQTAYMQAKREQTYLTDIANIDQLTQLLNRHALDKLFSKTENDHRINNTDYSLIVVDIDNFKKSNDTHGHAVGDAVIKSLASILRTYSRKQDHVCRWGGDEFVILLPSTKLKEAKISAEKLQKIVEHYQAWPEGITVTASFGVSAVKENLNIEQVFTQADRALYRSKEDGRNKVSTSDEL